MMHNRRVWSISEVESAEALAEMLTQRTWTLCSGFIVRGQPGYMLLNDSTHEDGAGEFAICKLGVGDREFLQVESITFLWLDVDEAIAFIQEALAGRFDDSEFAHELVLAVDADHGRCHLCA